MIVGAFGAPRLARHYDNRRLVNGLPFEAQRLALRPTDRSITVTGFCQIYALYGPTFANRVEYLTGDDSTYNRPFYATKQKWLASNCALIM